VKGENRTSSCANKMLERDYDSIKDHPALVSGNQLSEIITGRLKLDDGLVQLVQATAVYSTTHQGFDPLASANTQAPGDPSHQSAIAAAWHR
jgi:hypothetical protein